jgi:hypothetical protein
LLVAVAAVQNMEVVVVLVGLEPAQAKALRLEPNIQLQ